MAAIPTDPQYEQLPPFGPLGSLTVRAFRRGDPRYATTNSVAPGSSSVGLGGGFGGGGGGGGGGGFGPQGPEGPPGPEGLQGPPGPQGEPGVCDEETLDDLESRLEKLEESLDEYLDRIVELERRLNQATIECDGDSVTLNIN